MLLLYVDVVVYMMLLCNYNYNGNIFIWKRLNLCTLQCFLSLIAP